MSSNDGSSAVQSEVRLSRTRSFPNVMASFLFSHRAWSPADQEYVPQAPNQTMTTDTDQPASTAALSISGLRGSHFKQGGFNWVDPDTNFSKASPPSSSSMRRSETWTTSFQRPTDLSQNATRPANDTSAGNGSRGISTSGSGSLRALQRSLSEVFGPNKIVVDLPEEARHETPEVAVNQSSAVAETSSSPLRMSAASCPTLLVAETSHTHSKSVLMRQFSLPAVEESDPRGEAPLPRRSSVHPSVVETGRLKGMVSMTAASRATSVDENQNAVGYRNYEDALKMAAGEMTSHDQVMQVPETAFSRPSRRFGIMEMLGSGERRRVRNKDVNLMAPQSW